MPNLIFTGRFYSSRHHLKRKGREVLGKSMYFNDLLTAMFTICLFSKQRPKNYTFPEQRIPKIVKTISPVAGFDVTGLKKDGFLFFNRKMQLATSFFNLETPFHKSRGVKIVRFLISKILILFPSNLAYYLISELKQPIIS